MAEYVIVTVDDWAGLYVNGKLFTENHSISYYDLERAGAVQENRGLDGTPFEQQIIDNGGMPQNLAEVPTRE